jgi:hypothetical protein
VKQRVALTDQNGHELQEDVIRRPGALATGMGRVIAGDVSSAKEDGSIARERFEILANLG